MNEYRHYRGRGRGNYQHGNNYRNQLGNNMYGSDVRRCNPNHFTSSLLPFPPFRETRPRWQQRPPQHNNWRGAPPAGPPRHFSYVRPYSPTNLQKQQQTRPLSPLPGSEEARQKAIAEASARIKQQLNLTESDGHYEECENTDENISDDCIILNELPLQGPNMLANNKTQDLKKRKHKRSSMNTPTIEELRKKILAQFTYMSKGKIQNLVNNPGSTRYDNALQHLVRDMRLHLSSELRNMYTNRDTPTNEHNKMIDHFNSIVPDLGIELVSLPDTMVAELSKILQLDVNNEIEEVTLPNEPNENVLVEPEDMFKQAEKLLSSTDFLNCSFDTTQNNDNREQNMQPEVSVSVPVNADNNSVCGPLLLDNFAQCSPIYNCPPPNINTTPTCTIISNPNQFQQNIRFDEDSIVYESNFGYSPQFTNEQEHFTTFTEHANFTGLPAFPGHTGLTATFSGQNNFIGSFCETVIPPVVPVVPIVPLPEVEEENPPPPPPPLPPSEHLTNVEQSDTTKKLNLNIPLPKNLEGPAVFIGPKLPEHYEITPQVPETPAKISERPNIIEIPKILKLPKLPEKRKVTEKIKVPEKPKVLETFKVHEKPKVPETPKIHAKPKVPEKPTVPETPKIHAKCKVPETHKIRAKSKVPEKLIVPETPKIHEKSKVPEKPKVPEKSVILESPIFLEEPDLETNDASNPATMKLVEVLRDPPVRDDSSPFSKKIQQDPIYEDAFKLNVPPSVMNVINPQSQTSEQKIINSSSNKNKDSKFSFNFNSLFTGTKVTKKKSAKNTKTNQTTITPVASATITQKTDTPTNKLNVTSFLQDVITNNLLDLPPKDKPSTSDFMDKRNKFISETSCESTKSLTERNDDSVGGSGRPFNRTRSHSPYDLNHQYSGEDTRMTKSRLSLDERIKEMMKIQESRTKPKDQESPPLAAPSTSVHVSKNRKKRERKLMQMKRKQQQKRKEREKQKEMARIKQIEREKQKKIEINALKELLKRQQKELEKASKVTLSERETKTTQLSVNVVDPVNNKTQTQIVSAINDDNSSLTANLLDLCNLKKSVGAASKIPIKLISKAKSKTVKTESELDTSTIKIKEEPISEDESSSSFSETETSVDNASEKTNIIHNLTKDILNPPKNTINIRHFENIDSNLNITNKILETPIKNFKIIVETNPVSIIRQQDPPSLVEEENIEDTTNLESINHHNIEANNKESVEETENNTITQEDNVEPVDNTLISETVTLNEHITNQSEISQDEPVNKEIIDNKLDDENVNVTAVTTDKSEENKSSDNKKHGESHNNSSNKTITSDKKQSSDNKKSVESSNHQHKKSSSSTKKVDDKKHRHGSVDRKKEEPSKTSKVHKRSDSKHKTSSSHHHHHQYHHHSDHQNSNSSLSSNKQKIISRLFDIDLQIQKLMQEKWNLYKELNVSNIQEQLPNDGDSTTNNVDTLNRSRHSKSSPETKTKDTSVAHISTQTESELIVESGEENTPQKQQTQTQLSDVETTPKKNKQKKSSIKNDTKNDTKNDIKNNTKNETKNNTKNNTKNETKNDTKNDAKDETKNDTKDDTKTNKRKEVDSKKNLRKRKLSECEESSSIASSSNILELLQINIEAPVESFASDTETKKLSKTKTTKTRQTRNSMSKIIDNPEEKSNEMNTIPKLRINLLNVKSKIKHVQSKEYREEEEEVTTKPNNQSDTKVGDGEVAVTKGIQNSKKLRNKKVLENEVRPATPTIVLKEDKPNSLSDSKIESEDDSKTTKGTHNNKKLRSKKVLENNNAVTIVSNNPNECKDEAPVLIVNTRKRTAKTKKTSNNKELIVEDKPIVCVDKEFEDKQTDGKKHSDEINDNTIRNDEEVQNTKRKTKKENKKNELEPEVELVDDVEVIKKTIGDKKGIRNNKSCERRNSRNRSATPSSSTSSLIEHKTESPVFGGKRSRKRKGNTENLTNDALVVENKKIKLMKLETDMQKVTNSDEEVENLLGFNVAKDDDLVLLASTPTIYETEKTGTEETNTICSNISCANVEEIIENVQVDDNIIDVEPEKRKQIKHNRKLNKIVMDNVSTDSIDNIYVDDDVNVTSYDKLVKSCFVQLERINITLNDEDSKEEEVHEQEEQHFIDTVDFNDDLVDSTSLINDENLNDILLEELGNEDIDFNILSEPKENLIEKLIESPNKEMDVIDENGMFCMGHQKSILDIKIVGDEFFAASEDGTIYKYCLKSGLLQDAYTGHKRAVTCIYTTSGSFLNIDSTLLYSGSLDCSLKCYNIETAEVVHSVTVAQAIQCLDSAWGYIFLGTYEGLLFIYDMKKKVLNEESLTIANATVLMIKATQEGSRQVLILASRKREIMVRDAFTGLLLRTMCEEQKPTIYSLLLDRSMVYCGTSDKGILILDFNNGQQVGVYNSGKGVVCMLMYRSLLFAGCYDGLIYVYNTRTQEHVTTIPGPGEGMLLSLAICKDVIVAGSKKDHLLKIWKIPQELFNQIID